MSFDRFDMYVLGPVGEELKLLTEALAATAVQAGLQVRGADAQGLVRGDGPGAASLRFGRRAGSPLVSVGTADLVVAMDRQVASQAASRYLRDNGTLLLCDQDSPSDEAGATTGADDRDVDDMVGMYHARLLRVCSESPVDRGERPFVLFGAICRHGLIPEVAVEHYEAALKEVLESDALEEGLRVFREELAR